MMSSCQVRPLLIPETWEVGDKVARVLLQVPVVHECLLFICCLYIRCMKV